MGERNREDRQAQQERQENTKARTRRNILLVVVLLLIAAALLTAWAYHRSWGWGHLEGTVVRKDQSMLGSYSITVEYEQAGLESRLKLKCTQEEYKLIERGTEISFDFEINHMTDRAYLTDFTFMDAE